MYNQVTTIIGALLVAWTLVACSFGNSGDTVSQPVRSVMVDETSEREFGMDPMSLYSGETSLEERIVKYPVVVRATLDRVTSEAIALSSPANGEYAVVLKLHLEVEEYLNGTGSDSITGIWPSYLHYGSMAEAEADRASLAATRSAPYDDLEAIFFLTDDFWVYDAADADDTYYLGATRGFAGGRWHETIDVRAMANRLWLPTNSVGAGDSREYILALPGFNLAGSDEAAESSTSTITLAALKTRVAAVNAELNKSTGTAENRRQCLSTKYKRDRSRQYTSVWLDREPLYKARFAEHTIESGAPAGTVIFEDWLLGGSPDVKYTTTWLEGADATLFEIADGDSLPGDQNNIYAATKDHIVYPQRFTNLRPLPSGEYAVTVKEELNGDIAKLCFDIDSVDWTVTSTPWEGGATHEFFFDPVTIGNAVLADASNGVLNPASFLGKDGATSTISRLAWEPSATSSGARSGQVKLLLISDSGPEDVMGDHIVDFIELDGTVSLSLKVADATVDAANDTLSWTVSSQPWESGDKLMARVRRAPPSCSGGVAVPNPASPPDLVRDCETLLWVKDALAGTSTLNWGVDRAISSWDGVTVGGTPKRVTGLDLNSRTLNGIIPPALGELDKLSSLDLGSNGLTGEIPSELGGLTDLARLRLSGNRFTGCIPAALRDVSDHDLDTLGLDYCAPPAPTPQGLNVSLAEGAFAISWDRVSGVDRYRVRYRAGGTWVGIGTTLATSVTFSPVGGLVCETTYEFRVQARGDGTTWAAEWGEPSDAVSVTTGTCNPPPAPGGVEVVANSDGTFGVTWTAVNGADLYRVRYRVSGDGWSDVGTTTDASVTVSPSETSQCGSVYELGVRARGDGETYVAVWGAESAAMSTRGGPCNSAPVFGESDYTFSIARNAPAGVRVGTVSASDPDGDAVSYSISAGNTGDKFAVATSTGRITVAGTLDSASVSSYTLTVDASDGNGGTATATVAVSVATSSACYMGTVVPNVSAKPILARDCEILLSVRDTLAGTSTLNWSASATISTWDGVTLRRGMDGVHMLYLTGRDLNGTIPPGLGEIENLHRLDLDENRLTGPIPPELAGLSRLSYLFLFDNMLSGEIPPELGSLSRLKDLDLSENPLSGEIPPELGELSSLERLALESNRLTGEIPPELGNLSNLTELWLRYNRLSGEIPSELQGLSNLNDLFVSSNSFTGCIPIGLREVNEHDLDKLGLSYCAPPSAPTNLTASTTHDRVTLSWDAPSGSFVTGYQVLRRRPDHGETDLLVHVADTGSTDTTYTDTDVGAGTRYVYRIKAINSAGIGPYSKPVTATTARAP